MTTEVGCVIQQNHKDDVEEEKLPSASSFSGFEDTTSFSWQRSRLYNEQDFILEEFLEDKKTMYGVFAFFLINKYYVAPTELQSKEISAVYICFG